MKEGAALIPDGGAIILTSSVAGVKGMPNASVYAASKDALRSFCRTFAAELGARNIRVNATSRTDRDANLR